MKENIVEDDDCAVVEVDLRQLRGDVMDMIVQFLRWDRAETERGCYGDILPILMVAASARTLLTLEESVVHKEGLLVDQYGRIPYVHRIKMLNVQSQIHRMWKCCMSSPKTS